MSAKNTPRFSLHLPGPKGEGQGYMLQPHLPQGRCWMQPSKHRVLCYEHPNGSCGPAGCSSPTYQPHQPLLSHNELSAPSCLRAFAQAVPCACNTEIHATFYSSSGQVSSSERDLPHQIWDPHVLPGPRGLCWTPVGCCSCPNKNIGPNRKGSRTCPFAHHSGFSMSHLLGAQCLLNSWGVLPHLLLCETGKRRPTVPQGVHISTHSGVKPSSVFCLLV